MRVDPGADAGEEVGRTVLVTGFGAFLDVVDNPASALASALHGRVLGGARVVAIADLPVSYARALARTTEAVDRLGPVAVLGIGVARRAQVARVEDTAWNRLNPELADVDGVRRATVDDDAPPGESLVVSGPAARLAALLGIDVNPLHDPGGYVCNAWAYGVSRAVGARLPVCFLHVPPHGFDADRLAAAITALWGG